MRGEKAKTKVYNCVKKENPVAGGPPKLKIPWYAKAIKIFSILIVILGVIIFIAPFAKQITETSHKYLEYNNQIIQISKQSDWNIINKESVYQILYKPLLEFLTKKPIPVLSLKLVDNTLISTTILIVGISLYTTTLPKPDKDIYQFQRFLESFFLEIKKIDIAILAMIIITLSVHFLAKVLDNREKLEKEFAFSIGFLILSLTAYIYLSRRRSE